MLSKICKEVIKTKELTLVKYVELSKELQAWFEQFGIKQIHKDENSSAYSLAKRASTKVA